MGLDEKLIDLKDRLEAEIESANPETKGCFGKLCHAEDMVCINCVQYEPCKAAVAKTRLEQMNSAEHELEAIVEKYNLDPKAAETDRILRVGTDDDVNWEFVIIEMVKRRPKTYAETLIIYRESLSSHGGLDLIDKHRVFYVNANFYVDKILAGLEAQNYIGWYHDKPGSPIEWRI